MDCHIFSKRSNSHNLETIPGEVGEVTKASRKLAHVWHPDTNPDRQEVHHALFQEVSGATAPDFSGELQTHSIR
jgi:hypothetical protein